VRSKFSCVRLSHDLCKRAHAHSLEGTLSSIQAWDDEVIDERHDLIKDRYPLNARTTR